MSETMSRTSSKKTRTEVRVWDPLVRLFHWSLVLTFTLAYFTGEEDTLWHIYSGYIVLGLISFRLLWGFIGSKHARFSDFVTGFGGVMNYLKSLTRTPKHYLGHNPASGWMIIALLVGLFVTTLSGLQLYAVEDGLGPFAEHNLPDGQIISNAYADDDDHDRNQISEHEKDEDEDLWEDIHEAAANFTLFLVLIHIAGVVVAGRIHKENLVKAMITGRKSKG